MKNWTEQDIATLKTLHAEGRSYSYIADKLGRTRSATTGKANRIGLRLDNSPRAPKPTKPIPANKIHLSDIYKTPRNKRLTPFKDTKGDNCRWVYGDPIEGCCGDKITKGAYCAKHAVLAFRGQG